MIQHSNAPRLVLGRSHRRGARGLSLLEVLFAALLVATVAVFLAPFFVRAIGSNTRGGEASQATNFGKSFIEQSLAIPINHPQLALNDGGTVAAGDDEFVRTVLDLYFDRGPRNADAQDEVMGDEQWRLSTAATENYDIARTWDMELRVRDFSYFDILGGLISVEAIDSAVDPTLVFAGDPYLFDDPISRTGSPAGRHFKELTAIASSRRSGTFRNNRSQYMTTRKLRSY